MIAVPLSLLHEPADNKKKKISLLTNPVHCLSQILAVGLQSEPVETRSRVKEAEQATEAPQE